MDLDAERAMSILSNTIADAVRHLWIKVRCRARLASRA